MIIKISIYKGNEITDSATIRQRPAAAKSNLPQPNLKLLLEPLIIKHHIITTNNKTMYSDNINALTIRFIIININIRNIES